MNTHLVIPDSHTNKYDNTDRFFNLGLEILKRKPDKIIILGDFFDFESINKFDKPGSLAKEGQRIIDDIKAGLSSYELFLWRILSGIKKSAKTKKRAYKPEVIFCEGNHEYRLKRLAIDNAIFEGLFDLENKLNEIYPCKYISYGEYIEVDGILYTHIPHKNGLPIQSVVNTCGSVLDLVDKSVVFGHTHRLEFKQRMRVGHNNLITAYNAGCFFEGVMDYVKTSNPPWWKGISILKVNNGSFDIETISMEQFL